MNLKTVSKNELLTSTEKLVREERRITTSILWHLHEIERRRLFAELGFASLFEYATIQLKYSSGSAMRRISAMRLLKEIPEVGEKILADINPVAARPSRERVIAATRTEIRIEASDSLYAKIQLLKGKFAHKLKGSNDFADLLELLIDDALETKPTKQSLPPVEVKTKQSTSRYVPKQLKRELFQKSKAQCTYIDPKTKRKCTSTYALEIEHIKPLAMGGTTETKNLTLLCRTHNQLSAIQKFGLRKMNPYLRSE